MTFRLAYLGWGGGAYNFIACTLTARDPSSVHWPLDRHISTHTPETEDHDSGRRGVHDLASVLVLRLQ